VLSDGFVVVIIQGMHSPRAKISLGIWRSGCLDVWVFECLDVSFSQSVLVVGIDAVAPMQ